MEQSVLVSRLGSSGCLDEEGGGRGERTVLAYAYTHTYTLTHTAALQKVDIPSGLQAIPVTSSCAAVPALTSTSHFFPPCIFHKLMVSLVPRRDITRRRSLSGLHEEGRMCDGELRCSTDKEEKLSGWMEDIVRNASKE